MAYDSSNEVRKNTTEFEKGRDVCRVDRIEKKGISGYSVDMRLFYEKGDEYLPGKSGLRIGHEDIVQFALGVLAAMDEDEREKVMDKLMESSGIEDNFGGEGE